MRMKLLTSAAALALAVGSATTLAQQGAGGAAQQPRMEQRDDQDRSRAGEAQERSRAGEARERSRSDQAQERSRAGEERPRAGEAQDRSRAGEAQDRSRAGEAQERPRSGEAQDRSRASETQERPRSGTTQAQPGASGANQPVDNNRAGSSNRDPTRSGANPDPSAGSRQGAAPAQPGARQGGADTESAQSGQQGRNGQGRVNVSTEQRTRIREAFGRDDLGPSTNVNFSVSVGVTVPSTVRGRRLPSSIVAIVPQYRDYEYVVVRDEIVIIEPRTRRVVEVIDRRDGPRTTGSVGSRARITLDDRERTVIRRLAREGNAPRASTEITVRQGEMLPESVTIVEVPETIVTEVPELRSYRYVLAEDRIVLIEPQSRQIIEVIE